jgi:hypothetical protein
MMLAVLMGTAATARLTACGDKFLVPIRGTLFEQAPMRRQSAAVLLYANPASPLFRAIANLSIETALRKVGYQPTLVATSGELAAALDRGPWDLVILDVADVPLVVGAPQQRTKLIPVTYAAPAPQSVNPKNYPRLLKTPRKAQTFIDAIDAALDAARSGQTLFVSGHQ